jgi:hypothetical protein
MPASLKYSFSDHVLFLITILAIALGCIFKWNDPGLNYVDGDARDYYSYLISAFVKHDLTHPTGNEWYLLHTSAGTINVHPAGVSVLLLPFFFLAYIVSIVSGFPADGMSLPFQLGIAAGALFYSILGLHYIRKTLLLQQLDKKIIALVLLLTFFGTNLLHYALSEALMSHVYSFCLVSIFIFHSSKYALLRQQKNLLLSGLVLGLIVLVRPNNILILFTIPFWFQSYREFKDFLLSTFRSKYFYFAMLIAGAIVFIQPLLWFAQSGSFFHHTYKADGFYWMHPQLLKMLFGFDSGFFVYVPLCLLFMFGIFAFSKGNKWRLAVISVFILGLFYFFSSYWAYTYFDGLGIRVLVDYYPLFSLLGAKLFSQLAIHKLIFTGIFILASFLAAVSAIYCYQYHKHIIQPAGMTFNKWKYVFLHTGKEYEDCLGGAYDLKPYSSEEVNPSLTKTFQPSNNYDFNGKDFGVGIAFDSLGFNSNQVNLEIDYERTEKEMNSSQDAAVCVSLEENGKQFGYLAYRLNDAPSTSCCGKRSYHHSLNLMGKFKNTTRIAVYIWNRALKAFTISNFTVKVYNYNYQIN